MKKISLKRVTETLSDKELKNILGGSGSVQEGGESFTMKCFSGQSSCWVAVCPSTREEAESLCMSNECGGGYGSMSISCS